MHPASRFPGHSQRRRFLRPDILVAVVSVVATLGCGSSVRPYEPSDAAVGGGTGPLPPWIVSQSKLPAECRVASSARAPFEVKFDITNKSAKSIHYLVSCLPDFQIASCASGYQDDVTNLVVLPCLCPSGNCPVGGPCFVGGIEIAPGATKEVVWNATVYDLKTVDGRSCHAPVNLPAARYRFKMPIYASAAAAMARTDALAVLERDFTLPARGGRVSLEYGGTPDAGLP